MTSRPGSVVAVAVGATFAIADSGTVSTISDAFGPDHYQVEFLPDICAIVAVV